MVIRRLLGALQREIAGQAPRRLPRPNELSREVLHADRLRQTARRLESSRRPVAPAAEEQPRREQPPAAPAPRARATPLAASLTSRSELRRALLLKEILGPPAAFRWPRAGDPEA